jgi:hypothetical protein
MLEQLETLQPCPFIDQTSEDAVYALTGCNRHRERWYPYTMFDKHNKPAQ